MEYERLTTEKEYGCSLCKDRKCKKPNLFCKDRLKCEIYNRLAELETKIEQGTLVDTEERFIVEDELWGSKNRFLICKHHIETLIEDFCPTREEAKKRLKELQG